LQSEIAELRKLVKEGNGGQQSQQQAKSAGATEDAKDPAALVELAKQCEANGEMETARRFRDQADRIHRARQAEKPLSGQISTAEWRLSIANAKVEKAIKREEDLKKELAEATAAVRPLREEAEKIQQEVKKLHQQALEHPERTQQKPASVPNFEAVFGEQAEAIKAVPGAADLLQQLQGTFAQLQQLVKPPPPPAPPQPANQNGGGGATASMDVDLEVDDKGLTDILGSMGVDAGQLADPAKRENAKKQLGPILQSMQSRKRAGG